MREVITTGKTVEEATEKACLELGLERSECSVEIIDYPVNKLFKKLLAKVKVTSNADDEPAPVKQASKEAAQCSNSTHTEKVSEKSVNNAVSNTQSAAYKEKATSVLEDEEEESIDLSQNAPAAKAAKFLGEIISAAGMQNVQIIASKQANTTVLRIEDEDIYNYFDINGDFMQAISFIVERAVNIDVSKGDEDYIRVRFDVAGYREKRERELTALANKTAEAVLEKGYSISLSPMNSFERLIIHTIIGKIEGVSSSSVGSDENRRVVIKNTTANAKQEQGRRYEKSSHNSSYNKSKPYNKAGGHGGGHSRPSSRGGYKGSKAAATPAREFENRSYDANKKPVVPKTNERIKDGDDLPLYGKIEL
jgi:spoIIIJ-associated protein